MDLSLPVIFDQLANQEAVLGIFLTIAGLAFMLMGLRIFKPLVVLSFGVIGFIIGVSFDASDLLRILLGIVIAGVLGLASARFVKPAVAVLTGCWAALFSYELIHLFGASLPRFP